MTKVIIVGHGGYATAVKRNLNMLVGETPDFLTVDFNEQDDLNILKDNLTKAIEQANTQDILFACDLVGGSPFRECAVLTSEKNTYAVVAGINTAAFSELNFNLELKAMELAELAAEVGKQSIMIYPPKE